MPYHGALRSDTLEQDPRRIRTYGTRFGKVEKRCISSTRLSEIFTWVAKTAQWCVCGTARAPLPAGKKKETSCLPTSEGVRCVANTIVPVRVAIIPTLRCNNIACYSDVLQSRVELTKALPVVKYFTLRHKFPTHILNRNLLSSSPFNFISSKIYQSVQLL